MYFHKHQDQVFKFSLTVFKEKLLRLKPINGMDQAVVHLVGKEYLNGEPNVQETKA